MAFLPVLSCLPCSLKFSLPPEEVSVLRSALSPEVADGEETGWEEATEVSEWAVECVLQLCGCQIIGRVSCVQRRWSVMGRSCVAVRRATESDVLQRSVEGPAST
jgi:hypothetical protein